MKTKLQTLKTWKNKPHQHPYGAKYLTVVTLTIAVFWDVTPYNLVEFYRRIRETECFLHQVLGVMNHLY
jgi:hypothetical protein